MVRVFSLLIVALMTLSCYRSDREPTYTTPKSETFLGIIPYDKFKPVPYRKQPLKNMPAAPNDSYAKGYQAGCQTMSSAVAEGLYRVRGPKIEPDELTSDPWYLRGYEDAATACTFTFDWELH